MRRRSSRLMSPPSMRSSRKPIAKCKPRARRPMARSAASTGWLAVNHRQSAFEAKGVREDALCVCALEDRLARRFPVLQERLESCVGEVMFVEALEHRDRNGRAVGPGERG